MTAIRATFSDFKLIRTRKVAQLVMEVPLEQANAALKALGGVPQAETEQWVGIAPIQGDDAPAPAEKPRRRFSEMSRAQQAGMMCADLQFQEFCCAHNEVEAADYVRSWCDIDSRSKLDFLETPAAKWDELLTEFDAWRGKIGRPKR